MPSQLEVTCVTHAGVIAKLSLPPDTLKPVTYSQKKLPLLSVGLFL